MIAFRSPRSLYKPAGPCPGELIHTETLEEEEEDDDEFWGGGGWWCCCCRGLKYCILSSSIIQAGHEKKKRISFF